MTLTMRVFYLDAKKMKFSLSGWGLIFGSTFLVHVCFQGKFTRKMRKCKNKKKQNKTKMVFKMCLHVHLLSFFFFFLSHVSTQVAIYVLITLYFILTISHISIFYLPLNGRDYFNTIPKLGTKLTHLKGQKPN